MAVIHPAISGNPVLNGCAAMSTKVTGFTTYYCGDCNYHPEIGFSDCCCNPYGGSAWLDNPNAEVISPTGGSGVFDETLGDRLNVCDQCGGGGGGGGGTEGYLVDGGFSDTVPGTPIP
jgi:hypothetical protein